MIYNLEYLDSMLIKETKVSQISDIIKNMLSNGYNANGLSNYLNKFMKENVITGKYEDDLDDLVAAMEGWCHSDYQLHPSNFENKNNKSYRNKLEPCNRCCSGDVSEFSGTVTCANCNHNEKYDEWQLRGWRDLTINFPTFGGTIHVYGKEIGRTMAKWDADKNICDNPKATHWLRVPDPTKQINMNNES
jgi:hypothetical protein